MHWQACLRKASAGLVPLMLAALPAAPAAAQASFKVSSRFDRTLYQPKSQYEKTLIVEVKDAQGVPITGADIKAKVLKGPVRLFKAGAPGSPAKEVADKTAADGTIAFGLDTHRQDTDTDGDRIAVTLTVTHGGKTVEDLALGDLGSGFEESFRSDRISSEVFMGATFARSYNEEGESSGFDETSLVGRFRVDTLWKVRVPCWNDDTSREECIQETRKNNKKVFRRDNWGLHTGLELQFSSFPSGNSESSGTPDRFSDFADAYTGSLVAIYQPAAWASYSDTSHNRNPDLHYDALRHGLTGRVSVTSRDAKEDGAPMGDTDIFHYRVGYLFTHHQTADSNPSTDTVNVFPMRFVEISYAHYEEIFGQEDQDRLVLEAGLRLPGLGNDAVPFYSGLYLNAGEGQDDFRVFAGFLFRLDRIARALR